MSVSLYAMFIFLLGSNPKGPSCVVSGDLTMDLEYLLVLDSELKTSSSLSSSLLFLNIFYCKLIFQS